MSPASTELIEHPPTKVWKLNNRTCPYCATEFSKILEPTLEHVIGRRFVPKGTLLNSPNLHLNACRPCNGDKSQLEDDISVISMHPDVTGRYPVDDPRLVAEVARKRKAKNRRTGRPVSEKEKPLIIKGNLHGAAITFSFESPPQVDEVRVYTLARYQIRAFLYRLTYRDEDQRGALLDQEFYGVAIARRADWGNPQFAWFQNKTKDWLTRLHIVTADGFFRVWIKRKSLTSNVWAWALEWNQNFRVVGFAGHPKDATPHFEAVPQLELDLYQQQGANWLRGRTEVSLAPENDKLFTFEEPTTPA